MSCPAPAVRVAQVAHCATERLLVGVDGHGLRDRAALRQPLQAHLHASSLLSGASDIWKPQAHTLCPAPLSDTGSLLGLQSL